MKKLVVLILCLAICTGLACSAQQPDVIAQETEKTPGAPAAGTTQPTEENILIQPENQETGEPGENGSVENTLEPTEAPTPEPTEAPTPEPTEVPTPTPKPTPQQVYGAPQSFKPTKKIEKSNLPVVYSMYKMNPKGKKEAQMFTFDLNGDGKAEKISFKLDSKKNRTTITAGETKIKLKDGAEMVNAMLIDLDPATPYTDLVVLIDAGSDDYITIPLHIENGKFVRGESLNGISVYVGSDGVLYRCEGTDLLGTQTGIRACHGESFTPDDEWLDVSLPTEEHLQNYQEHLGDYGWFLQVKRELPCTIDGEPSMLPVGTILYMTRFHESRTMAEVRTLDGVTALITFTMDEDDWPYLINGIRQDDYFEYELLYAD
jgi:hypothetical protein